MYHQDKEDAQKAESVSTLCHVVQPLSLRLWGESLFLGCLSWQKVLNGGRQAFQEGMLAMSPWKC